MNQFSDQNNKTESGSNAVDERFSRRGVLKAGIAAGAGVAALAFRQGQSPAQRQPGKTTLVDYTMVIDRKDTALVVIDPQNDVLSEKGVSWNLLRDSLKKNNTVENLARFFKVAKNRDLCVFISPHYLYPHDQAWQFGGAVEQSMLEDKEFWRPGPLTLAGFSGSGADWLERFKPFIEDGKTVVASPHKVYGLQSNDLVLQLRKRRISRVILAGMMANLCVETHLRELLEQGFEVAVVKDATAAPKHPSWGYGYTAALINYAFLAHAVLLAEEVIKAMKRGQR